MAQQYINTGSEANDRTGDPIRNAFIKTNSNFTELYPSPLPPQYFVFAAYTFFNFPPSTAIGFQALKIQDDDDSSPLTGTWFPTDNMFYMPYNGELTKLTVTVNSNIGAFFVLR